MGRRYTKHDYRVFLRNVNRPFLGIAQVMDRTPSAVSGLAYRLFREYKYDTTKSAIVENLRRLRREYDAYLQQKKKEDVAPITDKEREAILRFASENPRAKKIVFQQAGYADILEKYDGGILQVKHDAKSWNPFEYRRGTLVELEKLARKRYKALLDELGHELLFLIDAFEHVPAIVDISRKGKTDVDRFYLDGIKNRTFSGNAEIFVIGLEGRWGSFIRYVKTSELENLIHHAIAPLRPRQKEVLIKYYGLFGVPNKTLEAIGNEFSGGRRTRENVRQARNLALRNFRNSPLVEPIIHYVSFRNSAFEVGYDDTVVEGSQILEESDMAYR